jgi:hypothetical protein
MHERTGWRGKATAGKAKASPHTPTFLLVSVSPEVNDDLRPGGHRVNQPLPLGMVQLMPFSTESIVYQLLRGEERRTAWLCEDSVVVGAPHAFRAHEAVPFGAVFANRLVPSVRLANGRSCARWPASCGNRTGCLSSSLN